MVILAMSLATSQTRIAFSLLVQLLSCQPMLLTDQFDTGYEFRVDAPNVNNAIHTSPNIADQSMFMYAQNVNASNGHFNNVGGPQSNIYYRGDGPNTNYLDGSCECISWCL